MITTSTALGQALATIVSGLRLVLGQRTARIPALAPLIYLIHNRLGRMVQRLDCLARHFQAGTLPKPRQVRPPQTAPRPQSPERPYIPSGQAWLIHLAQPTAAYITHIEALLARPDTQELLQAAPQAGRILRPLCRMLGIKPPAGLRRPVRATPKTRAPAPRRTPRSWPAYLATLVPPSAPVGPDFYLSHVFRT